MEKANNPVKAVETTVRIVEALKRLDGATVTELADHLDLTKGTAHNHVSTLEQHRFVVKEEGRYELSLRFLIFGEYVRNEDILYQVGEPEIRELVEETGEIVHLSTEQHGLSMKLCKLLGEDAVGERFHAVKLQRPDYLHYTATGKAILAFLPRSRVERIVDEYGLAELTDNTITDRAALFDELEATRERGYSLNDQEEVEGIRAVGAPVRDGTGRVLGAVSVSGPVSRMREERFRDALPEKVTNTTSVIEANINLTESIDRSGVE
ncbi:ArcR family transcription regulator [Halogeometricum pallidum JCM 14848]|uniref:ArcR family transcription regulator n=1 Tax=Halogeometricum pallidum JCM 14848 TaxID=1227487 RepID=M0D909_HALPD|nr:IclR family transcriptional regulator [Halogeometricum pallidum]ELZ31313.1 ArcR family transcription regulator [Halogeometricum pallidum JCM 14848]